MPFRENQCVHIPVPSHTYTQPSAESLIGPSDPGLCKWRGGITQVYKNKEWTVGGFFFFFVIFHFFADKSEAEKVISHKLLGSHVP